MEQPPFPAIPNIPANNSPAPATPTTPQDTSAAPAQPSVSAPLPPKSPVAPGAPSVLSEAGATVQAAFLDTPAAANEATATPEPGEDSAQAEPPAPQAEAEPIAEPVAEAAPEAGVAGDKSQAPQDAPKAPAPSGHEASADETAPEIPLATGSLSEILAAMSSEATPLEEESSSAESAADTEAEKAEEAPAEKAAPSRPYPDILLQPLPRQDPLRFKWHLGHGLPSVAQLSDDEGDALAEASEAADAAPQPGFLRLYGLLNSGEPWEARLNFAELEKARGGIYIGRDPSVCRIVIPEESVSRRHAKLELAPKGLVITDQGSRNGVYVNGQQLAIYENRTPINDGDTLSLGDASLRVEINT